MKNKKRPLLKTMLIYGGIFLALLLAGLLVLSAFLRSYERSRPINVAEKFMAEAADEQLDAATAAFVSTLNTNIVPAEDCSAQLRSTLRACSLVHSAAESADAVQVFLLRDGKNTLGRLVLTETDKDFFGFSEYSAALEELDFESLTGCDEYAVPADWTVSCNGCELSSGDIVTAEQPYALLEEFYDDEALTLPYLTVYSTGRYISAPETVIRDGNGNTVDELDENTFSNNCTPEEKQAMEQASEAFIRAYILYSSNVNDNIAGNYFALERLMVAGSTVQKRMRYAVAGLSYASSRFDELQSLDFHNYMSLGNDLYLCDLTYINKTLGHNGYIDTENNLKLIFLRTEDGRLLVTAMSSY